MSLLSPNREEYGLSSQGGHSIFKNSAPKRSDNSSPQLPSATSSVNSTASTQGVSTSIGNPEGAPIQPVHQVAADSDPRISVAKQQPQSVDTLSNYNIPKPPVSTQQSSVAAEQEHGITAGKIDSPRTLWMGDLDPWLDEAAIAALWWNILGKRVTVKVIKPKVIKPETHYHGLSHSGYCFVEFETLDDARQALSLNGQLLPEVAMPSQQQYPNNPDNQKKYFRLNWASGATLSAPIVHSPEYSLFVGDLSASTTEAHLLSFFQKSFPDSVKTVRVMTDPVSGKSRCFGFVRFSDELERQRALVQMQGVWFGGRPLRVALATPKNNTSRQKYSSSPNYFSRMQNPQMFSPSGAMPMSGSPYGYYGSQQMQPSYATQQAQQHPGVEDENSKGLDNPYGEEDNNSVGESQSFNPGRSLTTSVIPQGQAYADPNNTTVFVGGLSSEVTEHTLFTLFKPFGVIQQVKIPPGKNCGFIKYTYREEAEEAIASMQGFIIGGNRVRLSWGRISMNKKYQHQQQQVAHAAQLQAAAALSMGMDPTSAIAAAAAAAAAAAGYHHPVHGPSGPTPHNSGIPMMPGMHSVGIPHHVPLQPDRNVGSPGVLGHPDQKPEDDPGADPSEQLEAGPFPNRDLVQGYNPYYMNMHSTGYPLPPHVAEQLLNSMANLSLGPDGDEKEASGNSFPKDGMMVPPMFSGGYPIPGVHFQQYPPHGSVPGSNVDLNAEEASNKENEVGAEEREDDVANNQHHEKS